MNVTTVSPERSYVVVCANILNSIVTCFSFTLPGRVRNDSGSAQVWVKKYLPIDILILACVPYEGYRNLEILPGWKTKSPDGEYFWTWVDKNNDFAATPVDSESDEEFEEGDPYAPD